MKGTHGESQSPQRQGRIRQFTKTSCPWDPGSLWWHCFSLLSGPETIQTYGSLYIPIIVVGGQMEMMAVHLTNLHNIQSPMCRRSAHVRFVTYLLLLPQCPPVPLSAAGQHQLTPGSDSVPPLSTVFRYLQCGDSGLLTLK
jgi:hypothetical protein